MVVVLIGGMFLPTWWCTWFRGSRRQVVGVDLSVLVLVIVSAWCLPRRTGDADFSVNFHGLVDHEIGHDVEVRRRLKSREAVRIADICRR